MPYTNVDIFREKWAKSFSKKVWEPLNFMKKFSKKIIVDFFWLSFNSKLSHSDKNIDLNLNLNHKCLSPTWTKPIWFLIYGEASGHSELTRQTYGERLPQMILSNARTFVNVVQHLRDEA
jgi:hypothetical protein